MFCIIGMLETYELFFELIAEISAELFFQAAAYTYQTSVFCIGPCIFS